jgi:hypothetical protein
LTRHDVPGFREEEVTVQKTVKWVVVAALIGAIIVIIGLCQQGEATVKPQEVEITFNEEKGHWQLPPITVPRTGRVRFDAKDKMVWMLFPGDFNYVEGKGTFCKSSNLLAIAIGRDGYAVIEVPDYFPNPDIEQTITYSVMIMKNNGKDAMDWQYAHGNNPPPRMIIPKK